jgi:hypothetical protein
VCDSVLTNTTINNISTNQSGQSHRKNIGIFYFLFFLAIYKVKIKLI